MNLFRQPVPKEVVQQILNLSDNHADVGAPRGAFVPVVWNSQGTDYLAKETLRLMHMGMNLKIKYPGVGAALLVGHDVVLVRPDAVRTMIEQRGYANDWNGFKKAMKAVGFEVIDL